MDKLTVSKVIGIYTSNFNKEPLVTKSGKPYLNAKVCFTETGDKQVKVTKWDNKEVKVGDTFVGKVVDKEYNGKKYTELEVEKKSNPASLEIAQIKFALAKHDSQIKELLQFKEDYQNGKLSSNFSADRVNTRIAELEDLPPDDEIGL